MPEVVDRDDFCHEVTLGDYCLHAHRVSRRALEAMWEMPEARVRVLSAERSLEERFKEQADKWGRETAHLSSPLQRMMHPSYQAILSMGSEHKQDLIRLLLRDLKENRRDWLLALSYLTKANPISSRDAGKTDKLISSWLKWGIEQGLM